MSRRRIEQPAELRDLDRARAGHSLYEQLYRDEQAARETLLDSWRASISTALAWGLAIGYAAAPASNGWWASLLALCALLLQARAVQAARKAEKHSRGPGK